MSKKGCHFSIPEEAPLAVNFDYSPIVDSDFDTVGCFWIRDDIYAASKFFSHHKADYSAFRSYRMYNEAIYFQKYSVFLCSGTQFKYVFLGYTSGLKS